MNRLVLTTLGVGAAESPRFAPAGLLVALGRTRLVIDGGPGSEPPSPVDAWLVTDKQAELIARIRVEAERLGLEPAASDYCTESLSVSYRPVVHTSHPTGGYLIRALGWTVAWAPEFWAFPAWAVGADLMFAEASGWDRPIRFAGGVGGHMSALGVAAAAHLTGVGRLVFAHIGRPTLRAMDRGDKPPFGDFGRDGQVFRLGPRLDELR